MILAMRYMLAGLALIASATQSHAQKITPASLRPHIEILSSDAFEGRKPGTDGERKTTEYIINAWTKAGLKPVYSDGQWVQAVPLIRRTPKAQNAVFYSSANGLRLRFANDEILLVGKESVFKAGKLPLFFAGYGVNKNGEIIGDVTGKIVVMIGDEAAFLPSEKRGIKERREALIKAGAAGVLIILDERIYPVARRQIMTGGINLQSRDIAASVQAIVGAKFAVGMVTAAGRDWDKLRAAALKADYQGEALGIHADFDLETNIERFDSANIIAKISGKKAGSGAVLLIGHWDHLGICAPEGSADRVCNGAVDNASGIAALTEIGRVLAKTKPDRDIYLLATTAEEDGLLGMHAFAEKPIVPLDQIKVAFNIDTAAIAPKGTRVAIIGRGQTPLDPIVDSIIIKTKRKAETSLESNAYLKRQDAWVLLEKGVPALMVTSGFADPQILSKFIEGPYHGVDDELNPNTELGGAAEDAMLHVEMVKYFSNLKKYPSK